MRTLAIPYSLSPGERFYRPMIWISVSNLRNGRSVEVLTMIDTGADVTLLDENYLERLGLETQALTQDGFQSADNPHEQPMPVCDHLTVALMDSDREIGHFIGGHNSRPVPVGFVPLNFEGLLGRKSCLDLMTATFNGPERVVTLKF